MDNAVLGTLNTRAWRVVDGYRFMEIAGHRVNCPYAINLFSGNVMDLMRQAGVAEEEVGRVMGLYKERRVEYGWYRGKGSPGEIVEAAEELAKRHGYSLSVGTADGVAEFMKLFGLGVDCSGMVYHILEAAWSEVIGRQAFINFFDWPSADQVGVSYAGSSFLAKHSQLIEPTDVEPMDLIFLQHDGRHTHVAIVLQDDQGLQLVQSNIAHLPTGINVSRMMVEDGSVNFNYQTSIGPGWNDLPPGRVEFRRLNLL